MIYALEHLGENVPVKTNNPFYGRMIRELAKPIGAQALSLLIGKDPTRRFTPDQVARLEKVWGRHADEMAHLEQTAKNLRGIAKTLREADVGTIRSRLHDSNRGVRSLVIRTIAQRRLPLEGDLIDLLSDPHARSAAHAALVRVARGTDFGPIPGGSRRGIERSIEKWKQWLALQQSASPEALAKGATHGAGQQAKDRQLEIVPLVLIPNERSAPSPEAAKLTEELVNATDDEQPAVLAHLRDAKGIDNTDALALAIPKLSGNIKRQARDALVQRLTRMTAATLRDKLQDDNVEVRYAAALACGRKNAREHIPDLLLLLDDPERNVVQSARLALTELTGEDFGPASDADLRGCAEATAAWRKWWKERQEKQK